MSKTLTRPRELEGAGRPPRQASRKHAPARPVRRGRDARHAPDAGGRRPLPRLLEEPRHRQDAEAARRARRGLRRCADRIAAMFRGDRINTTENRAVLHVALRAPRGEKILARRPRRGARRARGARPHGRVRRPGAQRHVARPSPASASATSINIGIGGSDLGPVMAYEALRHYSHARPRLAASSPTSTPPTWPRPRASSTRPRRCSSCRRRRSRRWRR